MDESFENSIDNIFCLSSSVAAHASQAGYKAIIISAEDTDAFALCFAFSNVIAYPMYQRQSTKRHTRFIDIKKLVSVFGVDICQAILGVPDITGCDSISSFAGKGKLIALKLSKRDIIVRQCLKNLGED